MDSGKPGTSKRIQRAKSDTTPNRSTKRIKSEMKEKFIARMKLSRSQSVDRFRGLLEDTEDVIEYRTIKDLKNALLGRPEANYLVSDNELENIMEDIEKELNEAPPVIMEPPELDEISFTNCIMCNADITYGALCVPCREMLKQEFSYT